jgi:hypothetical protein
MGLALLHPVGSKGLPERGKENAMNHVNDIFGGEEFDVVGGDEQAETFGGEEWAEVESSSLTWDEETVRDSHREISLRARRASGNRPY